MSPVEEFIHLYHILLDAVQRFNQAEGGSSSSRAKNPVVGKSLYPLFVHRQNGDGLYAAAKRIRARRASGAALDKTKSEMATHLGGLMALTKQAIEQHP